MPTRSCQLFSTDFIKLHFKRFFVISTVLRVRMQKCMHEMNETLRNLQLCCYVSFIVRRCINAGMYRMPIEIIRKLVAITSFAYNSLMPMIYVNANDPKKWQNLNNN